MKDSSRGAHHLLLDARTWVSQATRLRGLAQSEPMVWLAGG